MTNLPTRIAQLEKQLEDIHTEAIRLHEDGYLVDHLAPAEYDCKYKIELLKTINYCHMCIDHAASVETYLTRLGFGAKAKKQYTGTVKQYPAKKVYHIKRADFNTNYKQAKDVYRTYERFSKYDFNDPEDYCIWLQTLSESALFIYNYASFNWALEQTRKEVK